MVIYKCDCSMCIKETNEKYIIWNRVLTISDKNIKWKRSSWFCMRGYNGTENTYMKYIKLNELYDNNEDPSKHFPKKKSDSK